MCLLNCPDIYNTQCCSCTNVFSSRALTSILLFYSNILAWSEVFSHLFLVLNYFFWYLLSSFWIYLYKCFYFSRLIVVTYKSIYRITALTRLATSFLFFFYLSCLSILQHCKYFTVLPYTLFDITIAIFFLIFFYLTIVQTTV